MNKKELLINIKYCLKFLPDKMYLKLYWFLIFKKKLNLENPKTFNEKLQWLKLNDKNPNYINLVDKYKVRSYIKNIIGNEYLVPIYGVWEKFEDINFDSLPNKFVLKCTHDSGGGLICKDKSEFDINIAKKFFKKYLKRNFFYIAREWPYKKVQPKIIAEKYLENTNKKELVDYKFMCFNGEVKCSFVSSERYKKSGLKVDFYDLDWNKMPFTRKYSNSNKEIEKPKNYKKMIELAQILAKDMTFARIDFYEIDETVYFGEVTLYPGGGFEKFVPYKYDEILGDWIQLPNKNSVKKGTGLKDKGLKNLDAFYTKSYKKITKFTYWVKEKLIKPNAKIDKNYKKDIKRFWKSYKQKPCYKEYAFLDKENKLKDVRYITNKIFHGEIEPYYNNILFANSFSDKNYLDLYFFDANLPKTLARNIAGTLLDGKYNLVSKKDVIKNILNEKTDIIIKPSIDSGGGRQVQFIKFGQAQKEELENFFDLNKKDYVIQKFLKQHESYSNFNSSSVNTVRVLSFLDNDKVKILYAVLRVGQKGSKVDNASSGGAQAVLDKDGNFTKYILDIKNKQVQDAELENKIKNKKLPFYDEIIKEVKRIHPRLAHFKLIGWDISVDETGLPTIIEVNLRDIGMGGKASLAKGRCLEITQKKF